MRPYEQAWRLLKMPVVDTDVPGLQMAYQQNEHLMGYPEYGADQEVIDAYNHPKGMIGNALGLEEYGRTEGQYGPELDVNVSNLVGEINQMTPNQYFDKVGESDNLVPDRDAEYRWLDKGKEHIQSIIDGVKAGQVMGIPALHLSGGQEGGHRMEALRQMGHGDTPVPVIAYSDNRSLPSDEQKQKGEPMNLAWRLLKAPTYRCGLR